MQENLKIDKTAQKSKNKKHPAAHTINLKPNMVEIGAI